MTLRRRWARQDDFDGPVRAASVRYGVEIPLIKAVIAAESAFKPDAHRFEPPRPSLPPTPDFPEGGDASFGLMQVLARTARALGYRGTLDGLFDPGTSIDLGTRLLRDNLARTGQNVADSVSAYNGGFRPSLGFGARLPSGQYGNQSYVSRVLDYVEYFRQWEAQKGGGGGAPAPFPEPVPPVAGPGGGDRPGDGSGVVAAPDPHAERVTWWQRVWLWIWRRFG